MTERIRFLFEKYIGQQCTEEEKAELMRYFTIYDNELLVKQLIDKTFDETEIVHKMSAERADFIFRQISTSQRIRKATRLSSKPQKWMVAASGIIFLGLTALLYNYINVNQSRTTAQSEYTKTKTAALHQIVKLEDGSVVVLNKNSSLIYSKHFSNTIREVTLIGEGYFDIKHESKRPFIVRTGKFITTVLGTAFDIKAFDKDKIVVTVTRGKVSVSKEQKLLGVLIPNEQIVANNSGVQKIAINAAGTIDWQSKDLFFEDVTMDQAVSVIEDRFNIKFIIQNDRIKDCRFTATFLNGETLDEILNVICSINNATYKKEANRIVLSGVGCN